MNQQTGPVATLPVEVLNAQVFAVQPTASVVRRRGWSLCHGCSKNQHEQHVPVNCQCDLCTEAT